MKADFDGSNKMIFGECMLHNTRKYKLMPDDDFSITLASWETAISMAIKNADFAIGKARQVGCNEFENDQEVIYQYVLNGKKSGKRCRTMAELANSQRQFKKRYRIELLHALQEQGRIEMEKVVIRKRETILIRAIKPQK